jgi:hypothetical protein
MAYGRKSDEELQGASPALLERTQSAQDEARQLESNPSYNASGYINQGIQQAERFANRTSSHKPRSKRTVRSFAKNLSGALKAKRNTKAPIIAVFIILFGGGGIISLLFSPGIAIMQLAEAAKELNSQLAAVDKVHTQLMRAKLKQTTAGSCGAIKVACRFKTVNIEKTEKAYKNTGISLEFDRDQGFGEGRGKITKMTFVDPAQPDKTIVIDSAESYTHHMINTLEFRKAAITAQNPRFLSLKNAAAYKAFTKLKTSPARKLTGTDTKSLDEDVKKASSGATPLAKLRLVAEKDEKGNETGRYKDEANGKIYTAEEARGIAETETRIRDSPSARSIVSQASKGVMITGAADTACTVYNTSRAVSFAAKTIMAAELARYAMIWLNLHSMMLAGDADPKQVEYAGKKIAEPDLREKVIDESKLESTPSGQPVPMIDNPSYKKSGLDADLYKLSAYQDMPKFDINTQLFMVGGGMVGVLDGVNKTIARAVGAKNPREITQRCRMVQNPVVRGGSLVVGIAAGLGSFGAVTAFTVAGSVALAFALPYLTAKLADIVAGEVTGPELEGEAMINATMTGANVLYSDVFREQGGIPLTPEQMVEYKNTNRQVQVAYDNLERVDAKNNPFDSTNRFSFLGSLLRTTQPVATSARTGGLATLAVPTQLLSTALGNFSPVTHAEQKVRKERYELCTDDIYREMNVAADPNCVLQTGMPPEAMAADPVEVALWMVAEGEISPDTGEATDKDAPWTYKKFLKDCIEQRPGAHEDPESSPDNGYGCADPVNYERNWRYAKYTLAKNWNDTLDGAVPGLAGGSDDAFGSGAVGDVGEDGWAFPTTPDATISSPYGPRGGAFHYGSDIAQPGGAEGKPIFAARDGKVIAAGPASGFGQWIVLEHEEGGERVDTVYGHMWQDGVFVRQGDTVRAGQEIGKIGNNGQSSGAHLHFEIWKGGHTSFGGGSTIDPAPMLERSKNAPTGGRP